MGVHPHSERKLTGRAEELDVTTAHVASKQDERNFRNEVVLLLLKTTTRSGSVCWVVPSRSILLSATSPFISDYNTSTLLLSFQPPIAGLRPTKRHPLRFFLATC